MKWSQKSKWSSVLLSSLLLLQMATATPSFAEPGDESSNESEQTEQIPNGEKDDSGEDKGELHPDKKDEVDKPTGNENPEKEPEVKPEKPKPNKPEVKPDVEKPEKPVVKPVEPEEEIYPSDIKKHIILVEGRFNNYKKGASLENGKAFLHALAKLPFDDDTMLLTKKSYFMEQYEKVSVGVKKELRDELDHYVIDELYKTAKDSKKHAQDYAIFTKLHLGILSDTKENRILSKQVLALVESLKLDSGGIDDQYYEDMSPGVRPNKPSGTITYNPNKPVDRAPSDAGGTQNPIKIPEMEYTFGKSTYYFSSGVCMKETNFYKNGVFVKKEVERASAEERTNCLAKTSATAFTQSERAAAKRVTGFDPYNKAHQKALRERLKLQKLNGEKLGDQEQDENSQELLDLVTIQYTFNQNEDSPYYYDTGIGIGKKKTVTYEQAKAALNIISIQAKGRYVEDKGQVLALIDGKVIRIKEFEKEIAFDQFAKEFELTPMKVRAQQTRTGTQQEIADLIEIKRVSSLQVNNVPVVLDANLIVDENVALYPAEQIISLLGGKSFTKKDKLTARIAGKDFVFTMGSSSVVVDDQPSDSGVVVRKNESQVWMIPIGFILKDANAEVFVEDEEIHINHSTTNQPPKP